jgi:hypothetical protein
LLHHGHFYTVGAADCGCHDNRMDKIWWNEAWLVTSYAPAVWPLANPPSPTATCWPRPTCGSIVCLCKDIPPVCYCCGVGWGGAAIAPSSDAACTSRLCHQLLGSWHADCQLCHLSGVLLSSCATARGSRSPLIAAWDASAAISWNGGSTPTHSLGGVHASVRGMWLTSLLG